MNKKKLARRARHASELRSKWCLGRAVSSMIKSRPEFIDLILEQDILLKALASSDGQQFPGGRRMVEVINK